MMTTDKTKKLYFVNILDSPYKYEVRSWRNQDYVRANMIDSNIITEEQHKNYLEHLKNTEDQKVFIAMFGDEPMAVMTFRIDWEDKEIVSGSYIIDEALLGKGFGVILGYVRMEYIFSIIPDGIMKTLVMETNKKNLSLQKDFGCRITGEEKITRSDGSQENMITLEMNRNEWEEKKGKIERLIERLTPLDSIQLIQEGK